MSDDPNRVVRWTCEIILLDVRNDYGSEMKVIGSSIESPEVAHEKALGKLAELEESVARLRGSE